MVLVELVLVCVLLMFLWYCEDDVVIRMFDIVYWMKGCSLLGLLCFVVLLDVNEQVSECSDLCFFDIKEVVIVVVFCYCDVGMLCDNVECVVIGVCYFVLYLGLCMLVMCLLECFVFVCELLLQDLKLEIDYVS